MKRFTITKANGTVLIKKFDETDKAKMDEIKELGWESVDKKPMFKKKTKKK